MPLVHTFNYLVQVDKHKTDHGYTCYIFFSEFLMPYMLAYDELRGRYFSQLNHI